MASRKQNVAPVSNEITANRLEAFSDGVIAIIITIMVLELKVPHDTTPAGLLSAWPVFLSYALSYLMVAIYWMNHHNLFQLIRRVDIRILWSNIFLLFSVSLIPFSTAYMGESHIASFPTAVYSGILLLCAVAYLVLLGALARKLEKTPDMACLLRAMLLKNVSAILLYALGVVAAFYQPAATLGLALIVAVMYILPNAWLEKRK